MLSFLAQRLLGKCHACVIVIAILKKFVVTSMCLLVVFFFSMIKLSNLILLWERRQYFIIYSNEKVLIIQSLVKFIREVLMFTKLYKKMLVCTVVQSNETFFKIEKLNPRSCRKNQMIIINYLDIFFGITFQPFINLCMHLAVYFIYYLLKKCKVEFFFLSKYTISFFQ